MQEEIEHDSAGGGDEVVAGATFFIFGLAVPMLFLGMAQGEDFISFLVIFVAFGVCTIFGEYYLTLTSGVAFGTGLVMTSLASFDWWFAGLAVTATLLNIGRYAASNSHGLSPDAEEDGMESMDQNHFV
jgi:hypothetical protein